MSGETLLGLAEEQAALRRIATLVGRGTPPEEVFAAVTETIGRLLNGHLAGMARYESDGTVRVVATWASAGPYGGSHPLVPGPWPLEGGGVSSMVWKTGQSVRIDDYRGVPGSIARFVRDELGVNSSVASPIVVEGRLWGLLFLHSKSADEPFREDTESRLTGFTELVGTAIAGAESRAGLARLVEEQVALRRVATLVARGVPREEVFAAVVEEVARLLRVEFATLGRYESDATMTTVATSSKLDERFPVGRRWSLAGMNVSRLVFETGAPARLDNCPDAPGLLGTAMHESGVGSSLGTPVIVDGHLWGVIATSSRPDQLLPVDTAERLASFTELVAAAIANTHSRAELMASRARIVAAADEMRRRIERDLHDGIQQRLVSLGLELRMAKATVPSQLGDLEAALSQVGEGLSSVFDELREIAHGIHPAILSEGGLGPALRALCRRSVLPVELELQTKQRLPESVEVAAYYVVSEALTNAAKYAHASVVNIALHAQDTGLRLAIRDDGIGGADRSRGAGLVGLSDRINALGGTLQLTSPAGNGTTLLIEIPVQDHSAALWAPL
ncbi:MAG: histidine kinase [Frankiales bacterium]|nr:histidine kinase [Frankiales bacterium]